MSTASHPEPGKIFNVADPGPEHQTTAAVAQVEAPTRKEAAKVEAQADNLQAAAKETAQKAPAIVPGGTGEPPSATDKLAQQLSSLTTQAAGEGKHDVAAAHAAGGTYVDQATSLATNALKMAQGYVPAAVANQLPASVTGQTHPTTTHPTNKHPESTIKATHTTPAAGGYAETAKGYLASAQAALQPQLDAAAAAAQPHLQKAAAIAGPHLQTVKSHLPASAQGYVEKAQSYLPATTPAHGATTAHGAAPAHATTHPATTGIPATSAPLESGPHTTTTPYPSTTTTVGVGATGTPAPKVGETTY